MELTLHLKTSPERKRGKLNSLNTLSTVLFYFSILLFIIGFNFTDSPPPFGWYQQFMPNLNNQPISDIFFIDSLTGWAVTGTNNGPGHINYVLKTTNMGDNWSIVFTDTSYFSRIKFINSNTGFVSGGSGGGTGYLYKSMNSGINWVRIGSPGTGENEDMAVLNQDTLWVVDHDGLVGGVYLTTNGGVNWLRQLNLGSTNPGSIYMLNRNIGFISKYGNYIMKTTNSGVNWDTIVTGTSAGWLSIHFVDSLTGWRCSPFGMKKTTDGGFNWITESLPYGGIIHAPGMSSFSNINRDTIWGNGGYILFPNNQVRLYLQRTTNGGNNWLVQIPDTSSIDSTSFSYINFINRLNGWGTDYMPKVNRGEIHTITGGDTNFISSIKKISSRIPDKFTLAQNYPNPFNISSKFKVQISKLADVKIVVFDVTGRLITTIINQRLNEGTYEFGFDGSNYSSGVYFYQLQITDEKGGLVYTETKKMILLK